MQRKTLLIAFFRPSLRALGVAIYFFSAFSFPVYANVNIDGDQSCEACATTPDQLITYTKFVKSILGVLQSTSKVDFKKLNNADSKQGQVNILTDYLKQESDSYFGVAQKEGRILGTNIQTNVRNAVTSFTRDFLGDFWRESTAGIKSTVYTRDIKKLEEVDNWIDTEATQHINNYVFTDPIPQVQYDALKQVFANNTELFSPVDGGGFDKTVTYKIIIGRLNALNRDVKNHVVLTPRRGNRFESTKGVNYTLNEERAKGLAANYDCVKSPIIGNCNPTRSKTNDIAKEFGKSVGGDFDKIMGKFQGSIKKLKQVFSKSYYQSYFDGFGKDWGVRYDGQNLAEGFKNAVEPRKEARDAKNQAKALLEECFAKAEENPGTYEVKRVFSVFHPNGKTVSCRTLETMQYPVFKNLSEAESAKRKGLLSDMNNRIGVTMNNEDLLQSYAQIASPLDLTKKFSPLSILVYESKGVLVDLIANSVDCCLSYCSNLNAQANCGSK